MVDPDKEMLPKMPLDPDLWLLLLHNMGYMPGGKTAPIVPATINNERDCLLWDSQCHGNRSAALLDFFNQTIRRLHFDPCFVGGAKWQTCSTSIPPASAALSSKVKSYMREPQCMSDWREASNQFKGIYGGLVEHDCCAECAIGGLEVDVYYWPEPNADTSCLGIIGTGDKVDPPLDDATTSCKTPVQPDICWTYWGYVENGKTRTTEVFTSINGVTWKMPYVNPWDYKTPPSAGAITSQASTTRRPSAGMTAPASISASPSSNLVARANPIPIHPRAPMNYSGGEPAGNGSKPRVVVYKEHTFTSPSIYVDFYNVTAQDWCGYRGRQVSTTLIAFAPGELSSIAAPHAAVWGWNTTSFSTIKTSVYNFADLPCPPTSVMKEHWWMPGRGDPYRPAIAFPSQLYSIDPAWKPCKTHAFMGIDPPRVLSPAGALVPQITPPADSGIKPEPAKPGMGWKDPPSETGTPNAGPQIGHGPHGQILTPDIKHPEDEMVPPPEGNADAPANPERPDSAEVEEGNEAGDEAGQEGSTPPPENTDGTSGGLISDKEQFNNNSPGGKPALVPPQQISPNSPPSAANAPSRPNVMPGQNPAPVRPQNFAAAPAPPNVPNSSNQKPPAQGGGQDSSGSSDSRGKPGGGGGGGGAAAANWNPSNLNGGQMAQLEGALTPSTGQAAQADPGRRGKPAAGNGSPANVAPVNGQVREESPADRAQVKGQASGEGQSSPSRNGGNPGSNAAKFPGGISGPGEGIPQRQGSNNRNPVPGKLGPGGNPSAGTGPDADFMPLNGLPLGNPKPGSGPGSSNGGSNPAKGAPNEAGTGAGRPYNGANGGTNDFGGMIQPADGGGGGGGGGVPGQRGSQQGRKGVGTNPPGNAGSGDPPVGENGMNTGYGGLRNDFGGLVQPLQPGQVGSARQQPGGENGYLNGVPNAANPESLVVTTTNGKGELITTTVPAVPLSAEITTTNEKGELITTLVPAAAAPIVITTRNKNGDLITTTLRPDTAGSPKVLEYQMTTTNAQGEEVVQTFKTTLPAQPATGGLVTTTTNGRGEVVLTTLPPSPTAGRVITTTDASGNAIVTTLPAVGEGIVKTTTDKDGKVILAALFPGQVITTIDAQGRPVVTTIPTLGQGKVTTFTDEQGNVITATMPPTVGPDSVVVTTTDEQGRAITTTLPAGAVSSFTTTYTDASGNVVVSTGYSTVPTGAGIGGSVVTTTNERGEVVVSTMTGDPTSPTGRPEGNGGLEQGEDDDNGAMGGGSACLGWWWGWTIVILCMIW